MICSMTRNVQFRKRLMLFVGAISITGCEWYCDPPSDHVPQVAVQHPVANPVSIAVADHSEIVKRIESHRGQVVVLDCWSTSCPPCIKEFPGLVDHSIFGDCYQCHLEEYLCISEIPLKFFPMRKFAFDLLQPQ